MVGGGRWEVGGGRWAVGGGRWEMGFKKKTITRRCSLGMVDKAPTQSFTFDNEDKSPAQSCIIVQRTALSRYIKIHIYKIHIYKIHIGKYEIVHPRMFSGYGGQSPYPVLHNRTTDGAQTIYT